METSSPLASLQPNHPGPFAQRCREYTVNFPASCSSELSNFNFKDMSMLKPKPDYFSYHPIKGSSPTTSLAADLSQNFHIEQSPALPTPRRTLFNNNHSLHLLHASRDVITPPIPSSSPGRDITHMETSPLPHKPPYSAQSSQVSAGIPTPDPTPMVDVSSEPPSSVPRQDAIPTARPQLGHQRRISSGIRPSLKKGYSMNQVSSKANGTAQSSGPSFMFGPGMPQAPKPILESFVDSPPSERKLPGPSTSLDLGVPPVPKLVYPDNGSPIGPVRRMSSARGPAPRVGLGRRTQSLQCGQAYRPIRQDKRCCTEGSLQPSVDLHEPGALSIPHFKSQDDVDSLPRISQETLVEVMNGVYSDRLKDVSVVDCRFEYEFEGGHIEGALNFNDKDSLLGQLFDPANLPPIPPGPPSDAFMSRAAPSSKTLIFHCEYSHHRAPLMARYIRQHDRLHNQNRYPHLTYPEIYILEGGYANFFKQHPHRCYPQAYVEMESKDHTDACERGMAKVKRRAKLSRAQTYAFGQSTAQPSSGMMATAGEPMSMLEESPIPPLPSAPFPKPARRNSDAMDLDQVMDDQSKRRSITFDSPGLQFHKPFLPMDIPKWLNRHSSY